MDKLTTDDAFELGQQFRDMARALREWRMKNRARLNRAEWEELDDREILLLNTASSMYTNAVGLILEDSQAALVRLRSSVQNAESAVQRIVIFKQALDLASALVLLAGAVYSGNAAGIPAAIVALEDAAEAIVDAQGSGA